MCINKTVFFENIFFQCLFQHICDGGFKKHHALIFESLINRLLTDMSNLINEKAQLE